MPDTLSSQIADDLLACCNPVTDGALTNEAAKRIAHVFKALGDATRVRLLSLIAATEGGEACICDLTEPVALSQPTVSHHMKLLTDAGLVTREQRGRWAYYRVADDALRAIANLITPISTQPTAGRRGSRSHESRLAPDK